MRRGVLMRKMLYSGAWNADVWLHLCPMSLADRSFDSDGNCVRVWLHRLHVLQNLQAGPSQVRHQIPQVRASLSALLAA